VLVSRARWLDADERVTVDDVLPKIIPFSAFPQALAAAACRCGPALGVGRYARPADTTDSGVGIAEGNVQLESPHLRQRGARDARGNPGASEATADFMRRRSGPRGPRL
jgi:hypothetical protein